MTSPKRSKVNSDPHGRKPVPIRMPASRPVHVEVPGDARGQIRLRRNLKKMGLGHLLYLPWHVTCPTVFQDLLLREVIVPLSLRGRVSAWSEEVMVKVYRAPNAGEGLCHGNDELRAFTETLFAPQRVMKNGWSVDQCLDSVNLRPVFGFLTPILKPEAQTRITLSLANTVVASFFRKRRINWTAILRDVLLNQVKKVRGSAFTYVAPYLAHLYYAENCLTEAEQLNFGSSFLDPPGKKVDQIRVETPVQPPITTPESGHAEEDACTSGLSSDSQLLEELLVLLECSRENLLERVKKLRFEALTQDDVIHPYYSPIAYQTRPGEFVDARQPTFQAEVEPPSPSCDFQPEETYSPTSGGYPVAYRTRPGKFVDARQPTFQAQVEPSWHSCYFHPEETYSPTCAGYPVAYRTRPGEFVDARQPTFLAEVESPLHSCEFSAGNHVQVVNSVEVVAPSSLLDSDPAPATVDGSGHEEHHCVAAEIIHGAGAPKSVPETSLVVFMRPTSPMRAPVSGESGPNVTSGKRKRVDEKLAENEETPNFINVQPLNSKEDGPLNLKEHDPGQMRAEYVAAIEKLAWSCTASVDPLPPMVYAGRNVTFVPTYARVTSRDRVPLLPISVPRRGTLFSTDIWAWVYHCRLVISPCLPYSTASLWPTFYNAWVGPDGVPVRKESDQEILMHRKTLLKHQKVKGKNSRAQKEIGWLADLPRIVPYPTPVRLQLR